ncbi:MAG: transporter, partial [Proteobacteria bacterium]|nr:transporter [Pseudomonadota bacterium]
MVQILRENPILLLFLVVAVGQILGRIQIAGFGLGVAAVLFVGLGFGALDPGFKLPDFVYIFGLTLFVYTMGISSGPGFFTSFKQKALRDNLMVCAFLIFAAVLSYILCKKLQLNAAYAAGLFSGALTNTPALAAVLDSLKASAASDALLSAPVVAYSLAYPGGVIGMLLAVYFSFRFLGQSKSDSSSGVLEDDKTLESRVLRVTKAEATVGTIAELQARAFLQVSFARMKRQGELMIATEHTQLQLGDLVSVVGRSSSLSLAEKYLGERTEEHLDWDRREIDFRRIFVSKKSVTEIPLDTLALGAKFGAVITRIRRGDVEIIPNHKMVLEPGDRVRVVAARNRMDEISRFLGDSYKALSEIDVITFSLGMALGLMIGKIPFPLGSGATFELGSAGGPLIVGLILGRLGRTGPFVWTLPYSANL